MLNEIDLSRADLNLLVLYEAVMRERHVGRAAARLHLSPSAVSHGLRRLRALLGDPLFLRTPRGMVPTERATALEPRVSDILAAIRNVVATAAPFDPATSTRRFRVGLGDAFLYTCGPALAARLAAAAPGIGLSVLHVLPSFRQAPDAHAWDHVLDMLDSRELDVALLPWATTPARFATRPIGRDRLVAVSRPDHPYARRPTLDTYCAARHLLVSIRGDPTGATDATLAGLGRRREVVMTVPNFSAALFLAAGTDLVVSMPQSLVAALGPRFGLVGTPLPFDVPLGAVLTVATHAALQDAGVAWLAGLVGDTVAATSPLDLAADDPTSGPRR